MEETRRYFFMVPNIVDDLGMAPQIFRVYCHIRRVAGEKGRFWESSRSAARHCGVSRTTLLRAYQVLEEEGLVIIHRFERSGAVRRLNHRLVLELVDIWDQNRACFIPKADGLDSGALHTHLALEEHTWTNSEPNGSLLIHRKKNYKKNTNKREPGKKADFRVDEIEPLPPAVTAVQAITGLQPNRRFYAQLAEVLGSEPDIKRLSNCFQAWVGRGYRAGNLAWALEWYVHGIPGEATWRRPQPGHGAHRSHDNDPALDATTQAELDYLRLNPGAADAEAIRARLAAKGVLKPD